MHPKRIDAGCGRAGVEKKRSASDNARWRGSNLWRRSDDAGDAVGSGGGAQTRVGFGVVIQDTLLGTWLRIAIQRSNEKRDLCAALKQQNNERIFWQAVLAALREGRCRRCACDVRRAGQGRRSTRSE